MGRKKNDNQTIDVAPFPALAWSGYAWEGEWLLRTWVGFRPPRRRSSSPDGTVTVSVADADDEHPTGPSAEQVAAFRHLLEQEKVVSDAILQAVFDEYPTFREEYLDAMDEEAHENCPEITRVQELRPLIGLRTVHVLRVAKDGIAYVGFQFACAWDSEHGLGVMTHLDRCVSLGGADQGFLAWIAEADAGG